MTETLTQERVAALQSTGKDRLVFDGRVAGFGVRITPTGRKIFIAQGRLAGKPIRVTLGYADTMKVVDARRDAIGVLDRIAEGIDPRQGRMIEGSPRRAPELTLSDFVLTFLEEHVAKLKPSTAADYERVIKQKIKPRFGARPIAAITRDEISTWHAEMGKTPRRANYALAILRKLLTFAELMGKRPPGTNPAKGLTLYRENSRERFLSVEEITLATEAITLCEAEGRIGPWAAAGLRLAMLTGARSGEITAMKWSYLDDQRRLVVLPDSKTGKRVIYFSEIAWDILQSVPRVGEYVIAGAKRDEPYKNLGRAWIKVRSRVGLNDVRLHDLRHTFASMAAGKGLSLPMIGKLLGHRVPATTTRYAHLAVDPVIALNDEIGDAFGDAMAPNKVVPMPKRQPG